jgi:hypothetical protein
MLLAQVFGIFYTIIELENNADGTHCAWLRLSLQAPLACGSMVLFRLSFFCKRGEKTTDKGVKITDEPMYHLLRKQRRIYTTKAYARSAYRLIQRIPVNRYGRGRTMQEKLFALSQLMIPIRALPARHGEI